MHADELHLAVNKVVGILEEADIRAVIDQYRSARGDQRSAAAARLSHAAAVIMERIGTLSAAEQQVVKCLHLESLGSAGYWQALLNGADNPKKHQGELVRLASRVMFASSQLPGMIKLLDSVDAVQPQLSVQTVSQSRPLAAGEGRLRIRLTDAGERASDPDRVARAIDGIDMMYSACASIARKPAMDLRIDDVLAKTTRDRDLKFTGERDGIAATHAVIDSIPAALADIDPGQDINLDAIVRSLPIFKDLKTLAALGTFTSKELKDISDTMHQGALLTLESGVILLNAGADEKIATRQAVREKDRKPASAQILDEAPSRVETAGSAAEQDQHYAQYLREREAMLQPQAPNITNEQLPSGQSDTTTPSKSAQSDATVDTKHQDAVGDLLKSLGQSRSS